MARPSGEPEWANPREIVRTIVTMSQMCRRKPNTPLRFLVISDIFPFQRRGQLGKSRKALPRFRQPSIQQSTESNHNHEARWRVQVGSEKTQSNPHFIELSSIPVYNHRCKCKENQEDRE